MHIELPRVCVMFITACTRSGLLCALGACCPPVRSALGARKCIEARRQGSNWLSPQAVTRKCILSVPKAARILCTLNCLVCVCPCIFARSPPAQVSDARVRGPRHLTAHLPSRMIVALALCDQLLPAGAELCS